MGRGYVVNVFETCCWRRMLKTKWTDTIMNDEVLQRAKEERLLLQILKNRYHLRIGHIIRHNKLVVNILEGAMSVKMSVGRPRLQYLKQVASNTGADSYTVMKRTACNKSRWKAANQSKERKIERGGGRGEEDRCIPGNSDHSADSKSISYITL
jgi:hypothetical protein